MWDTEDEFYFAWKRMKGDFQIDARAKFVGEGKVAASQDRRDRSQVA